jgi:prepilin-type N-terminal cleavage/methylation domain-containing protein
MIQKSLKHARRSAFTLIELLVVITIIALLVSLMLAAIFRALAVVKDVQNRNDISQIADAIAAFKRANEVDYIPSKIDLTGATQADNDYLGRVFPQLPVGYAAWSGLGTLQGDQCIVFFLGGYQSGGACSGFSSDPKNPWQAPAAGEIRKGPYYDFKVARLRAVNGTALSYMDVFGFQPFAYFTSYGTSNSYVTTDCSAIGAKPYLQSTGVYMKPDSFQLLSAGPDGQWGPGGLYNPATLRGGTGADDSSNFAPGRLGAN